MSVSREPKKYALVVDEEATRPEGAVTRAAPAPRRPGECEHRRPYQDACAGCGRTALSVSRPDPEADKAVRDRLSTKVEETE